MLSTSSDTKQSTHTEVVAKFADRAATGQRSDRPEWTKMLQAARRHEFDVLIVDDLNRFPVTRWRRSARAGSLTSSAWNRSVWKKGESGRRERAAKERISRRDDTLRIVSDAVFEQVAHRINYRINGEKLEAIVIGHVREKLLDPKRVARMSEEMKEEFEARLRDQVQRTDALPGATVGWSHRAPAGSAQEWRSRPCAR
jgi:hypothetical protein